MTAWTSEEPDRSGAADERDLASPRRDGTPRTAVPIWVVRLGDDRCVRSVHGRSGSWFRGTHVRHAGRIRAGTVERDVTFVEVADVDLNDRIDTAYRAKERRYGARSGDPMLAPAACAAPPGS